MQQPPRGRDRRRAAVEYTLALIFLPLLIAVGLLLFVRVAWSDWRARRPT